VELLELKSRNSNKKKGLCDHLELYHLIQNYELLEELGNQNPNPDLLYKMLLSLERTLARDKALLESSMYGGHQKAVRLDRRKEDRIDHPDMLLSRRELDVLTLLAKGYSYTEIAELLRCQVGTIQTYIKRIYKKLNVHSRSEAIFEAGQMGFVQI
jgi:DNA-binding NarL/FixJ family response regulator